MNNHKSVFFEIISITSLLFFIIELGVAQNNSSEEFPFEQRIALFEYDKKADFEIKKIKSEKRGTVTIHDITFIGILGRKPIEAYIVEPEGPGPFAGILWGHWLGHHTSDRNQYLDEAVNMASKGVISVLINAMWSEPSWFGSRIPEEDYQSSIHQVIEMRRAMDLLINYKNVDETRIGFVGHDYSGMYGAIAAGLEPLAKTYVFIAVTSSLYDWAFLAKQPKSKVQYIRQNAVFELTDFIRKLKGSVFCQFSNNDPYVSKVGSNLFFNALTSSDKLKKRYDSGHFMGGKDVRSDRESWLIEQLDLN